MVRILVVDDEPEIVRLVRHYLEEEAFTVIVAYDGEEALAILRRDPPDLLVLDLGLPRRDGWDLTRVIRNDADLATLPIIMLTARVEDTDKIVGLELGADDYITKPFNPREVVARIRAVLRRRQDASTSCARRLYVDGLVLDIDQMTLEIQGSPITLTAAEFSLCRLLMEQPGYVYRRDEIASTVLGCHFEGSGRALDTHIKNLRRKIEPNPHKPRYIQTVHGVGYRFKRPESVSK